MNKIVFPAILLVLSIGALLSYYTSNQPIVQQEDFAVYMTASHQDDQIKKLTAKADFWQSKLETDPKNLVYEQKLAGIYAQQFRASGTIQKLHQSDSLLLSISDRFPNRVSVWQTRATNAITRHAFSEAETYAQKALQIGEERFASTLLLTDVLLEKGNTTSAKTQLDQLAAPHLFDYQVRKMKYMDAVDRLPKAIDHMEKAAKKAVQSNDNNRINWSYSNLADMYGHAGRIQKSYQTYLKALSYNPADFHSLKGIAWIAFAHDQNTALAKDILHFLQEVHSVPDYLLLLAEIADFEGDHEMAAALQDAFLAKAADPRYENMYRGYIIDLKAQDPSALKLAMQEVEERPHPVCYDQLAWAYFQNGAPKKAVSILEEFVIGRTGEPVAAYHAGLIYKANGQTEMASQYLEEALDASFELGPVVTKEVKNALQGIEMKALLGQL